LLIGLDKVKTLNLASKRENKMIIIPAIDILGGKCVRLFQGNYNKETVYNDDPVGMAKKWQNEGGKIIHLVDLDGARDGVPVNIDIIRNICNNVDVPCELGGGIRNIEYADKALDAGVARVILGTAAIENKELVDELLKKYGAEKVVIGIDAKNGYVSVKGWLEDSNIKAVDLAVKLSKKGIIRFIYTDIARDGALIGPNYDAVKDFCSAVPECKVIASGGVGSEIHVEKLMILNKYYPNIEGVIVGKALYDGKVSMSSLSQI
jgi:phosphoribosylformimino-5-aminoimidazole carboxamide ribotide isomerase